VPRVNDRADRQGIFGFLICIAGFISIQVTSPTTHMISSAVRGVIQTYLGVALFGDVLTGCVHLSETSLTAQREDNGHRPDLARQCRLHVGEIAGGGIAEGSLCRRAAQPAAARVHERRQLAGEVGRDPDR